MPTYLYKCEHCGLIRTTKHGAYESPKVYCDECNGEMHRKPVPFAVNWNGNKPSDGGITDAVKQLEADAPRRRDKVAEYKDNKNAS